MDAMAGTLSWKLAAARAIHYVGAGVRPAAPPAEPFWGAAYPTMGSQPTTMETSALEAVSMAGQAAPTSSTCPSAL